MGVLDQLEREAREDRERREDTADASARRVAAASARLAPAVERAQSYLEQLAGHLNERDRVVHVDYRFDELGELSNLRQGEYAVTRGQGHGAGVQMRFTCTGPAPCAAKIPGHPKAEAIVRRLKDYGLECRQRPLSEAVMEVRVAPRVPVRIVFTPDLDRDHVQLELRNLPTLGAKRYSLSPDRVDEELLDAVANLVLREPSTLDVLTDSVVDDQRRSELKRQLARDQRRRDAEVAGGIRRFAFPVVEWFRRTFLGG